MPITPLHLAVTKSFKKEHLFGFVMVNCAIDGEVLLAAFSGLDVPLHGTFHTLIGALILAGLFLWAFPRGWRAGLIWGAVSHVLLDAIVHADVKPAWPLTNANPLYFDGSLGWVSWVCFTIIVVRLVWLFFSRMNQVPRTTLKERRSTRYL